MILYLDITDCSARDSIRFNLPKNIIEMVPVNVGGDLMTNNLYFHTKTFSLRFHEKYVTGYYI